VAVKDLAFATAIIVPLDPPLAGRFAILEKTLAGTDIGELLLIRCPLTSGPERSPIGRGEAMRGDGPLGGGTPNVSRSGQRRRLSVGGRGIWSKLLIAAYECAVAYPHWCGPSQRHGTN
jgi:hypothetical protein